MTSIAPRTDAATPRNAQLNDEIPDYLDLPSDGSPVTVNVSYDHGIVFSLPSDTGASKGRNLSWQAGGYALFVTFVFEDTRVLEAVAITPSCWFSSSFNKDNSKMKQTCCAPPVPGTYHIGFDVELVSGTRSRIVDPKIVVTPVIIERKANAKRTTA